MNKYRAVKVKFDGYIFDSKKEYGRYLQLKMLERAGEIEGLSVHPCYPILINQTHVCNVFGDFMYYDHRNSGKHTVEDTKGFWTDLSRLKYKLVTASYPHINWVIVK